MSFDPTNTFILSPNDKGDNPKRPDWRGEVNIEGKTYELSGWIRSRRSDGAEFISGPVKPKTARLNQEERRPEPAPAREEKREPPPQRQASEQLDEDVPF